MKLVSRRLILIGLIPIGLLGAAGCASTGGGSGAGRPAVRAESFGAYDCVDRGPVAAPPPRDVPRPGPGQEQRYGKPGSRPAPRPLATLYACPEGKVPAARQKALPTVAKGNPLLGRIDRPVGDFFRGADSGEVNRRSLLRREKVYYIPPGPDQGRHAVPPDPPACNGTFYYGHCYYYGPASYARTADGGGFTTRIERPAFSGDGHSLNEISVQGGTGEGNIVELGWNVSMSQYSDADPHLFVFHWIDWSGTCYDGCGWVQYSATYFPGMNLGALVGRDVYNGYVFYEGNWWAWFDDQWLGYFPGSEWKGAYTQSTYLQWFGELATNNGTPPKVEMGDGLFPAAASAAPMVTLCDVDAAAWVCWYRDLQSLGPNYPPYYDILRTGFGATRYGGPGS